MEDQLVEIIKDTLDALDKLSIWIFTTFLVVLFSLFSSNDELHFGPIAIKRKMAGVIVSIMNCGLVFDMFKLLNNLVTAYDRFLLLEPSPAKIDEVKLLFRLHPWIFNPFSKTGSVAGHLTDNVGFPMLIIMWWIGLTIVGIPTATEHKLVRLASGLASTVYLLLGLWCVVIIRSLNIALNPLDYPKAIAAYIGIVLGVLSSIMIGRKLKLRKDATKRVRPQKPSE